jgi:3-(3-hydroxy-phenyl)propionate hydroxylase
VLLVGDAAHIHYPAGGQGIGLGVQDAVNLGWKLARVVQRTADEGLLDSYQAERHPATQRALRHSMAQGLLQRKDARTAALSAVVDELMVFDEPRVHIGALVHGLDIAYDFGAGHPLLGRRMPDLTLQGTTEASRVYELLREATPVLLEFDETPGLAVPAASGVRLVRARTTDAWALPVVGAVPPPSAVLIRPDGHVAWAGLGDNEGLTDAVARWFS